MTAKPFLKWAGGKRKLVDYIRTILPPKYNRYHEPMLGGGALFFALQPRHAFLNDANTDLIETYKVVRDAPKDLIKALRKFKNTEAEYLKVRAQSPRKELTRAARFIYLNKLSFNGLYRVNSDGIFNVPYCKDEGRPHFDESDITQASLALQGTHISCTDYLQALVNVGPEDLVFIDPPYDDSFTSYTSGGFNKSNQMQLKEAVDYLTELGALVIVCNSKTQFIETIYSDYNQISVQDRFVIASKGTSRTPKDTLFITNYTF